MPNPTENSYNLSPRPRSERDLFVHRYPDFTSWLDGQTWEFDIETEIHEPVSNFRASLYYQATCFKQKTATKVITKEDGRKYLLVRAYEAD